MLLKIFKTVPLAVLVLAVVVGPNYWRNLSMSSGINEHINEFSPFRAKQEDLARFYGTNERVSEANLAETMRLFHRLLSQSALLAL